MAQVNPSLQITGKGEHLSGYQKIGLGLVGIGFLLMLIAAFGAAQYSHTAFLVGSLGLITIGSLIYYHKMLKKPAGLDNTHIEFNNLQNMGLLGWVFGVVFTGFYVLLYWYPDTIKHFTAMFHPLSQLLEGKPADQWFMYGTLYTVAILVMGVKALYKYRHSRYQVIRTFSVMFFQLAFAFLIPAIMELLHDGPYFYKDLKDIWPLNYYMFFEWHLNNLLNGGTLGIFMLVWGIILILIITPTLTFFYGKRWYCSWVCGCGGLAETAGDPWRHLSDKSNEAWQIERIIIHGVLFLILVTTGLMLYTFFSGKAFNFSVNQYYVFGGLILFGIFVYWLQLKFYPAIPPKRTKVLIPVVVLCVILYFLISNIIQGDTTVQFSSYALSDWYGFFIGAAFSGVIGVGFYPIMGSRVWCRFGCPMAAILGLQQRFFSRFRITTNGGQCISCGNCSKYCEMGIDVQWYAQKGKNIIRSSCVGCGMCEAVCPRGVLHLENGPVNEGRPVISLKKGKVKVDEPGIDNEYYF